MTTFLDLSRFRSVLLGAILAIKGRTMRPTDMAAIHSDEVKRDAVRIAKTSSLTRRQVASDLGIGHSTLGKWVRVFSEDAKVPAQDAEFLRGLKAGKFQYIAEYRGTLIAVPVAAARQM